MDSHLIIAFYRKMPSTMALATRSVVDQELRPPEDQARNERKLQENVLSQTRESNQAESFECP